MNLNNIIKMEVKIKRLVENAVIPTYAHNTDAGLDLTAINYKYNVEHDCHIYGTGIAIEIPEGYVGLLYPRSSNRKTNAYLTNHVGVIDSGYRGEIMFSFKNRTAGNNVKPYNVGDRLGQIIIMPYPKIKFIESDRGTNGHGSSGN